MIELKHTCDIYRNVSTGQGLTKKMGTTPLYPSVNCLVLPMDIQSTIDNSVEYGQIHYVFFDESVDVRKGDKLVYNGNNYYVQGVKDYSGFPIVSHKEALAQREDI